MTAAQLNPKKIWYAASNEDGRSECTAIAPEGKRLLSITASGSRTFDLLAYGEGPEHILSIDQNPAQTALAEVFVAAYRRLSYPEFRRFVGLDDDVGRLRTLATLRDDLSPLAQTFWRKQGRLLDHGLLYCGKWEGMLRLIQRVIANRRREVADRLLAASSLTEQSQIWRNEWEDDAWHGMVWILSRRWLWSYIFREPGMAFIPKDFDIEGYAMARFRHAADHIPFAQSPFVWLLMRGKYEGAVVPPYLTEAGYARIRERLDRVTFATMSLQDAIANSADATFSGASLSDYSSYCDTTTQEGVWQGLRRVMAPGGRVCERKFFNKSGSDIALAHGFTRNTALEDALFVRDAAIFYSFVIAERTTP